MGGVTPLPSTYTRSSNQLNLAFTTNAPVAYRSAQPPLGAGLVPFPPLRQVPCAAVRDCVQTHLNRKQCQSAGLLGSFLFCCFTERQSAEQVQLLLDSKHDICQRKQYCLFCSASPKTYLRVHVFSHQPDYKLNLGCGAESTLCVQALKSYIEHN